MMHWTWKRNLYCVIGLIEKKNETADQFARSWRGLSPLFWRIPIFLWAVSVISVSVANFWGPTGKFLLYMTHWGLILIVIETLFGIAVTVKYTYGGFPDATLGLPWYVKMYWVLYNITIPVSFLITIFYWGLLRNPKLPAHEKSMAYAPNPIIDLMLHGVNSVVMFIELVSSAHPSRLMHVMQPLYFAGAYLLFSVSYYFAGGLDPWGHHFIYPVIDWSKPDQTMVVITMTALFLALMHLIVVGVASLRDVIAKKYQKQSQGVYNDGFKA